MECIFIYIAGVKWYLVVSSVMSSSAISSPMEIYESITPDVIAGFTHQEAAVSHMKGDEEWRIPRNYSVSNTEEIDLPVYTQSRAEMEDEMTLDGVLIWTDDAETDEYVQQDSDWTDNWQVRLTGVDSVADVERGGRTGMKSRLRRMLRSSKCLRGIGRLVGHMSRCFGCTRPRVYHCTTRVPAYAEEENVDASSIESLFCSETI